MDAADIYNLTEGRRERVYDVKKKVVLILMITNHKSQNGKESVGELDLSFDI